MKPTSTTTLSGVPLDVPPPGGMADATHSVVFNANGKRPLSQAVSAAEPADGQDNVPPALQRTGKNGEPLSEKKLRRLEKNRLSARECRRRKREATDHIQHQINLLEGENLRLRLQLQVGEEAEASSQQEQQKLMEGLDGLLKSGASESEIYTKIEEYKEKFADYGRDRRSAIEFHLRNIERLLMPTQTTSVIMATLNMGAASAGGDSATNNYSDSGSGSTGAGPQPTPSQIERLSEAVIPNTEPSSTEVGTTLGASDSASALSAETPNLTAKSLFRHLVKILEVSPAQATALKDSRFVAQEMDECLKTSLGVLTELHTRLTQCGEDLENEFNNVRSILTPTQAAKFLVWVANNKACMHMLNELWNRVYPQATGETATTPTFGDDDIAPSASVDTVSTAS